MPDALARHSGSSGPSTPGAEPPEPSGEDCVGVLTEPRLKSKSS